ncbi:MAG TPA: AAA family ATPase, partial [Bacteroidales bacterium]|nr:AAA family ATPase [Bacteroidales bacterium]
MQSPFKFLDSYTRDDREFFFGRDREIEALYQKVFESKILLVYGVSGTGKSSLIHCGLASKFNDSDWLPVNIRRGRDINEATLMELQKASLTEVSADLNKPKWMSKLIRSLYLDHFKPVYLVYDQFEELMIFGSKTEKQQFVQSVKAVVDSDLQCRFLFVIREEYLAGITEFERIIPEILGNRVRIEKMGFENARQAIEGPCRIAGIEVEEGFSENMLNRLTSGGGEIELTYLQVFLDRLYKQATGNGEHKQVPAFTNALVDNCGNVKDLLGDFLDEQVKSFENSDLAMTMLKSLVSGKGTKKQSTQEEIADFCRSMGKTIESQTLTTLLNHFVNLRILRDRDNYGRYELRHDALAEKIFENISIAEKELFEVRQFVENAYFSYEKRSVLLSLSDLKYLERYESSLHFDDKLSAFIQASKSDIVKRRKVLNRITALSVVVLALVFALLSIYVTREVRKMQSQKQALFALGNHGNYKQAFYTALKAHKEFPSVYTQKAILNSFYMWRQQIQHLTDCDPLDTLFRFTKCNTDICYANFSSNGDLIFGYLSDSTIRVWDNKGQERTSIRFNAEIMNLKISPDNLLLACVGNNDSLVMYSISGEKLYSFACSTNSLNQKDLVSFASQRNHVACISETNTAMVYNLSDGTPLQKLSSHRAPVTSVCFSPDEKWLLTASKDSTVQVWKYNETKNEYLKFVLLTGHTDVVWSAVFNKESNYILTASADSTVRMWKLTGEEHRYDYNDRRYYFASHLSPVARAVFSTSGTSIILDRYGCSGKLKRGSFANNGLWFELEQMSDKTYKEGDFRYY